MGGECCCHCFFFFLLILVLPTSSSSSSLPPSFFSLLPSSPILGSYSRIFCLLGNFSLHPRTLNFLFWASVFQVGQVDLELLAQAGLEIGISLPSPTEYLGLEICASQPGQGGLSQGKWKSLFGNVKHCTMQNHTKQQVNLLRSLPLEPLNQQPFMRNYLTGKE